MIVYCANEQNHVLYEKNGKKEHANLKLMLGPDGIE